MERAKAVLDVFQSKLIKRGISLKSLESGDPFASGKEFRIVSTLKDGISSENAKKINKIIRDEGGAVSEEKRNALIDELGDVFWYLAAIAKDLKVTLDEVARRNIEKLSSRQKRGKIGGSGDNR
jgi:NTP pyrophosphatase (non-canonical NTP hydrolase)